MAIKKVQIASWDDNHNYFDADGNAYRTMGDFAPSKGQWVWTNGKYIYGHTTGGSAPPIFAEELGVPVNITKYTYSIPPSIVTTAGYIDKHGKYHSLFEVKNKGTVLWLVNNKRNAYATTQSGTTYNLVSGEKLDFVFSTESTSMSTDNDVYGIENTGSCAYHAYETFKNSFWRERLDSTEDIDYSDLSVGSSSSYINDLKLNILKNGKVDSTISFDAETVKSKFLSAMSKYQDSISANAKIYPSAANRPQPSPYVYQATITIDNSRINQDGQWAAEITYSALGACFVYINHDYSHVTTSKSVEDMVISEWVPCLCQYSKHVLMTESETTVLSESSGGYMITNTLVGKLLKASEDAEYVKGSFDCVKYAKETEEINDTNYYKERMIINSDFISGMHPLDDDTEIANDKEAYLSTSIVSNVFSLINYDSGISDNDILKYYYRGHPYYVTYIPDKYRTALFTIYYDDKKICSYYWDGDEAVTDYMNWRHISVAKIGSIYLFTALGSNIYMVLSGEISKPMDGYESNEGDLTVMRSPKRMKTGLDIIAKEIGE